MSRATRYPQLDAMRGAACLAVLFFHVALFWMGADEHGWPRIAAPGFFGGARYVALRMGFMGVSAFLVLSGCCLALWADSHAFELRDYLSRRARRIVPAYWAALALFAAAGLVDARVTRGTPRLVDVVAHLAFVHNLRADTVWTINGCFWTQALELQLYLVFPLVIAVRARVGDWRVALGALAVAVAWTIAWRLLHPPASPQEEVVVLESLPARLFEFVCGMVAARLLRARARRPPALAVAVATLGAAVVIYLHGGERWPVDKYLGGVGFAALLVATRDWPRRPGVAWRALCGIGTFSYSIYLVHQPLIVAGRPLVAGRSADEAFAFFCAVGLPFILAVAYAFHVGFERPFLRGRTAIAEATA